MFTNCPIYRVISKEWPGQSLYFVDNEIGINDCARASIIAAAPQSSLFPPYSVR